MEGNKGDRNPRSSQAWFYRLPPYVDGKDLKDKVTVFQCPSWHWDGPFYFDNATPKSYKMNAYLDRPDHPYYRRGTFKNEANIIAFADAKAGETGVGQWGHLTYSSLTAERHGGCNAHARLPYPRAAKAEDAELPQR